MYGVTLLWLFTWLAYLGASRGEAIPHRINADKDFLHDDFVISLSKGGIKSEHKDDSQSPLLQKSQNRLKHGVANCLLSYSRSIFSSREDGQSIYQNGDTWPFTLTWPVTKGIDISGDSLIANPRIYNMCSKQSYHVMQELLKYYLDKNQASNTDTESLTKRGSGISCADVCNHCVERVGRRIGVLCHAECAWEGDSFKACVMILGLRG